MRKDDRDTGKQPGLYDTDRIRQRVQKWQADSAGAAVAKDEQNLITVEYEDDADEKKRGKRSNKSSPDKPRIETDKRSRQASPTKSPRTPRELDPDRQAWIRKKSAQRNDLDTDVKHAGAPLKRVVSDAHWRKDRSPTKTPENAPKSEPRPYTIKRTTIYKSDDSPKLKKDDDGIRVRPMPEDDGIRIIPIDDSPPTQPKPRKNKSDGDRPGSSGTSEQRTPEHQLNSRSAEVSAREKKDRRSAREVSRDNSDRRRRLRRRHASPAASEAETEDRSIAQTLDPDDSISARNAHSRKPRRVSSTVHETRKDIPAGRSKALGTDKMSAPYPNTTTAPTYGNRIEAWLGGTPDPFIADEAQQQKDGHKEAAESQVRSKRRSDTDGIRRRDVSVVDDERSAGSSRSSPGEPNSKSREILETIAESRSSSFGDGNSSYATSSVPSDVQLPDVQTSKHMPGANLRRRFPTTGKRLSTIASAETLQESAAPSEISEQDTIVPERTGSLSSANGLKRRLTRHEDLMSVLSLPIADAKSIVSARSIRTNRTRLEKATLQDLWNEFTADEAKYQRELRTLVDGVIPVLLSCVLSKSDSAIAVGLFGRSAADDVAITRPIVDMGVALERLKAHHRRVPNSGNNALLSWAQGATRIYHDYLKAWRMGFQDVVVNLAPADANSTRWDDELLRNEDGDLINGDGERVDVAFLLKRPLVRLKYLAKTFKGINILSPTALASSLAEKYQELVTEARRRSNEERARLEDEAAAAIDPTRARDPQSLALLKGVSIDTTRCVHARDYFDMNIIHSSGQQLDCRIELIIRDDCPGRGNGGDVLVCEVSDTGRWLLFPPLSRNSVSARAGSGPGDVVMMIRGLYADKNEWHELLSLRASDEPTGPEWVEMLGLSPVPPSLARQSSFLTKSQTPSRHRSQGLTSPTVSPTSRGEWTKEIQIPIGERSGSSRSWISDHSGQEKLVATPESARLSSNSIPTNNLERIPIPSRTRETQDGFALHDPPSRQFVSSLDKMAKTEMATGDSPGLRRARATRHKSSPPMSPSSSRSSLQFPQNKEPRAYPERPTHHMSRSETGTTLSSYSSQSTLSQSRKEYSVWMPSSTIPSDESEEEKEEDSYGESAIAARSQLHHRTSSVPVVEPPRASKLRQRSEPNSPIQPVEIFDHPDRTRHEGVVEPSSAPVKLQKRRPSVKGVSFDDLIGDASSKDKDLPPAKSKRFSIPSFTPNFLKRHRRSSSPLKHEYEPSIVSESSTESDLSYSEDDDESITSDSSKEAVEGAKDAVPLNSPLVDGHAKATPPASLASLPTTTLGPSNSASQAPYRAVPHQATNASKIVASIYSWSDRGAWDLLHPSECIVVVTPGLIEAFDLDEAIPDGSDVTSPSARGVQPLIAFEVTPLVPLRRGTALDISIRSPPTASSLIRASNNVMFRSRSAEECDMLYSFINTARINNPTYIALQNARGPVNDSAWAMNRDNNQRTSNGSWFHNPLRRSNTYRSKTSRAPSEVTDSSVGTMNTAFSALRRFNGNSRLFNIAKSTITSRQGSRTGTSESLSSGASTPITYDPSQGTPLGITNAKIRLYIRESQNKWRDMGSARLSILLPPRSSSGVPPSPRSIGLEKRILVSGKTKGETLLDVTLGESCFERVARTGIAVSVWEDRTGPVTSGGVLASKASTYMIQHKTERECAYTFGLVGKLRY